MRTKILLMPLNIVSYPSKHTRVTIAIKLSYQILPCLLAKTDLFYHLFEFISPLVLYNLYQVGNWWVFITETVFAIFWWGWSWVDVDQIKIQILIWKFTLCELVIIFLLIFKKLRIWRFFMKSFVLRREWRELMKLMLKWRNERIEIRLILKVFKDTNKRVLILQPQYFSNLRGRKILHKNRMNLFLKKMFNIRYGLGLIPIQLLNKITNTIIPLL